MQSTGSVRRVLLSAGMLLLALCVFALATESKTAQYGSEQHVSNHYKATDSSECRLKAQPSTPMPCVPVRRDQPVFKWEIVAPAPDPLTPGWPTCFASHGLRAPPAA